MEITTATFLTRVPVFIKRHLLIVFVKSICGNNMTRNVMARGPKRHGDGDYVAAPTCSARGNVWHEVGQLGTVGNFATERGNTKYVAFQCKCPEI